MDNSGSSIWRTHTCGFMPLYLVMDEFGNVMWSDVASSLTLCNWIDALEAHQAGRS